MSRSSKRSLDPRWLVGLAALQLSAAGCTPNADAPKSENPPVDISKVKPAEPRASSSAGEGAAPGSVPHGIKDEQPLSAGLVRFSGMVRPTKGGLDVRGATLNMEDLRQLLVANGRPAPDYDKLLGAQLSLVAELEQVGGPEQLKSGHLAVQGRRGVYFVVRKLVSVKIEAEAEQIEGVVARSKGFFSVSSHLVSREDLNWALRGGKDVEGERVRLWGQPRTVHCAPEAQCLLGGALPMFDVARAERVP